MDIFENAVRCDTDNRFIQANLDNMIELLNDGAKIWLYCWCIGHTKCEMVEEEYVAKLKEHFKDNLMINYGFITTYSLKEVK